MSDGPSREEMQRLYDTLDNGFAGVNARLDVLNGRTRTNEVRMAEEVTKVDAIRVELHDVSTTCKARSVTCFGAGGLHTRSLNGSSAFTKREVAMMAGAFSLLTLLMRFLTFVGEFAWSKIPKP